jgi:conjugative transfer region protein TrbK
MRAAGIKAMSRAAGFAAVAAAIVATAIHLRHEVTNPADHAGAAVISSTDPLARELIRCRLIGIAAKDDQACTAAWAEYRRRFFTYTPPPSARAGSAKAGQPQ